MAREEAARAQSVRVLVLLDALSRVGLAPTEAKALHELAYLANVLSPVFDLAPLDAKLLKRSAGPYYPELQQAIDRLVGRGLIEAVGLRAALDTEDARYRVIARYRLRREPVQGALDRHEQLYAPEAQFLRELAAAYSALTDAQIGVASRFDARFADASVDFNDVIDFGEWKSPALNFSRNAAMAFAPERGLEPAERLYLYLEHLGGKVAHVG